MFRKSTYLYFWGPFLYLYQALVALRQDEPYGFSSDFRLEDPWAQRRSLDLCVNPPEDRAPVASRCETRCLVNKKVAEVDGLW